MGGTRRTSVDANIGLARRVSTVERLHVLLHVAADPDRDWTCAALAEALGYRSFEVALHLGALAGEGLVVWDGAATARLSPLAAVRADVAALAAFYRERPEELLAALLDGGG